MRKSNLFRPLFMCVAALLVLSACKSAEEKAEEYYQSGLELIKSGDYDRAIVELRNVFEFDGSHRDARFALADIFLNQQGNLRGAYGQYLRLVEQYPDDLETRIILAETAFDILNWEEFERHGTKAVELSPDMPRVQAIAIGLGFRAAVLAEDASEIRAQGRAAETLLSELPDSIILRTLLLDVQVRDGEQEKALASIDWLLEQNPDDARYWQQRLGILAQMNDLEAVESQLLEMTERFPDNPDNAGNLLRFYLARGEASKAEAFLRTQAETAAEGDTQPRRNLISFLYQTEGIEAAMTEVEAAIADSFDPDTFRVIRAGLLYDAGEQMEAITEMEDVLATAEPSEQTNTTKIILAQMLLGVDNDVSARARVEEVLAADEAQPEALKMRASWQIDADEADEAINNLRIALDSSPEDPQAMTLMAQAYSRTGRPELAQEFLALAVEASGNAPEETLRYARILIEEERYLPAEDILLPALRLAPQNIDLLGALGTLYLRLDDLGRAEQVVDSLTRLQTPQGQQAANRLQAQIISQSSSTEEALAYLESVAQSSDGDLTAQIDVIRARLLTGDVEGSLALAQELQADNPDSLNIRALVANIEAANGNMDAAIEGYRRVLDTAPQASGVWLALSRAIASRDSSSDAARAVIEEALAVLPDDPNLLWAEASYLEQNGDIDGAIAIYEGLYERNSGSVIVANNLASLLSTYRIDETGLNRAWTVARRFRDTELPAMQDTYGWILHRRGESAEALLYMEAAAEGLPNDPIVQYHLGQIYQALERPDDALAQYRIAVQLAGPDDTRVQITEARNQVNAANN